MKVKRQVGKDRRKYRQERKGAAGLEGLIDSNSEM